LSRTAAIDVLFSINSAVVFGFIYFCFRPSKANSAEELRMLRQYTDATMPVAPTGNGVQICSVFNFQIKLFFCVPRVA
jgi:hypothetical protein